MKKVILFAALLCCALSGFAEDNMMESYKIT